MKRWVFAALLCVEAGVLAGPTAGEAPAPTVNDIFIAGETLDYELSWLGISGGAVRMTVGLVPNDPTRFRMTSIAKSSSSFSFIFKVRDEIESIVSREDFSTLRYDKHLNERGRIKDDTTVIDEQLRIATRQRPKHDAQQIAVPRPVFDPLSLVYHLRALDLKPGRTHSFIVFADGKVYRLDAKITGRETLRTAAGTFHTLVVEPKMLAGGLFRDNGSLTIWYSDDARHVPVRIRSDLKVGSITATLRTVRRGVADPEPAAH